MSAARHNGDDEGGGSRRFYKLVGAVVVALAIAAALVPLWLSSGEERQPRVVEVKPDALREQAGSGSSSGRSEPRSGEKWWQAKQESKESDSGPDSEPVPAESQGEPAGDSRDRPTADGASSQPDQTGSPAEQGGGTPQSAPAASPSEPASQATSEKAPSEKRSGEAATAQTEGPYWTVMVGSFLNPDNARGLRDKLEGQGYTAQVVTKTVENRDWKRVYAGRKDSREAAEALLPRLKEAGYKDLLVLKTE